jgi:hypothetical protein
MTFFHCSSDKMKTKPFAYTFLRLTNDKGVTIPDGEHVCQCYKAISGLEKGPVAPTYLRESEAKLAKSERQVRSLATATIEPEAFVVHTRLCSTKRTQNEDLHRLLNWEMLNDVQLAAVLQKKAFEEGEIVKFLREIFDVLLVLFKEKRNNSNLTFLVYDLFVYILNVPGSRGGQSSFIPVLTSYINSELFKGGHLYPILLRCVRQYASLLVPTAAKVESADAHAPSPDRRILANSITSFHLTMLFINKSRQQEQQSSEQRRTDAMTESAYKQEFVSILEDVNQLLRTTDPQLLAVKVKAVKSFSPVFTDLKAVFNPEELAERVRAFLEAMPVEGVKQLHTYKLMLIREVLQDDFFTADSVKTVLLEPVAQIVQSHLHDSSDDERMLSIANIAQLVLNVEGCESDAIENFVWILTTTLPLAVESLLELQEGEDGMGGINLKRRGLTIVKSLKHHVAATHHMKHRQKHLHTTRPAAQQAMHSTALEEISEDVDDLVDLSTTVMGLLHLLSMEQLDRILVERLPAPEAQKAFFSSLMRAFRNMVRSPPFPEVWLVMCMMKYSVIVKLMTWISSKLNASEDDGGFAEDASMDINDDTKSLWEQYFELGITTLGEAVLDIDSEDLTSAAKRKFQLKHFGDVRSDVVKLIQAVWAPLEHHQLDLSEYLVRVERESRPTHPCSPFTKQVGPLIELCENTCEEVAEMARGMYIDLIKIEFKASGTFSKVSTIYHASSCFLLLPHASSWFLMLPPASPTLPQCQVERDTIDAVDRKVARMTQQGQVPGVKVQSALEGQAAEGMTLSMTEDRAVGVSSDGGSASNSSGLSAGDQQSGFVRLFTVRLAAKFEADDELRNEKAKGFLNEIQQLFELLAAMASYPETAEYEEVSTRAPTKFVGSQQLTDP